MKHIVLEEDSLKGDTEAEKLASLAISPCFKAALTAQSYAPSIGAQDLNVFLSCPGEWSNKAVSGELSDTGRQLAAQMLSLDSIFHKLAGQARINIDIESSHVDTGAEGKNAPANTTVEALAEVHGTQNSDWEGNIEQERSKTRSVFS